LIGLGYRIGGSRHFHECAKRNGCEHTKLEDSHTFLKENSIIDSDWLSQRLLRAFIFREAP
jgi:hypothetical protein